MSLKACVKCWDYPCNCGYEWKNRSIESLAKEIATMLNYKSIQDSVEILKKASFLVHTGHEKNKEHE